MDLFILFFFGCITGVIGFILGIAFKVRKDEIRAETRDYGRSRSLRLHRHAQEEGE